MAVAATVLNLSKNSYRAQQDLLESKEETGNAYKNKNQSLIIINKIQTFVSTNFQSEQS